VSDNEYTWTKIFVCLLRRIDLSNKLGSVGIKEEIIN